MNGPGGGESGSGPPPQQQQPPPSVAASTGGSSHEFGQAMGGMVGQGGSFLADASQPYNAHLNSPQRQPPPPPSSHQISAATNNNTTYGGMGGAPGGLLSPPARGSVTQFATPPPPPQQQQQQPQQQGGMYAGIGSGSGGGGASSPYNFSPPPPQQQQQPQGFAGGGAGGGGGMSFAQRSAMLQQQQQRPTGGNVYGGGGAGGGQIQQGFAPQEPSNTYGGGGVGGGGGGGMSFAQRSQAIMSSSPASLQQQQQGNVYSAVPSGGNAMYPPTPTQQQQQQQQQPILQNSYMSAGSQVLQQPSLAGGSYAQRSAMMGQQPQVQPQSQPQMQPGMMPQQQQQQQQHQQHQHQQHQHQQYPGMAPQSVAAPSVGGSPSPMQPQQQQQQQRPVHNPMMDSPELLAQQQRLLTDATRKVQEHAYYMKQAMERNDLPAVLDRGASLVGELGEHAHSHHHHHVHPPAPGATGSTTALSPKNYYELHLRVLEELPTLEDYLLNLTSQQGQQQQPNNNGGTTSMAGNAVPGSDTAANPLAMGGGANSQHIMGQQQQQQQPLLQPGGMMPQYQQQHGMMQPGIMNNTNVPAPPKISYTMKELYDCVQYCPNVLSRLYLQICAASALIRSGEVGAQWVLKDMIEAVKCVQNPVRGLFLRHYLLQAFRDKLPNEPIPIDQIGGPLTQGGAAPRGENSNPVENVSTPAPVVAANVDMSTEKGTVKDSYGFILANFIEMNKLWVRIQHLPGDGKSKEVRRRREKDRNELRILVGTNLVRLSALDSITSTIYGQVILPTVLDQIVICADPLAQAYLIDCIVQVFPDEYHIETMPILLGVCPKLRDKVNIRTILQSLMDRLANYLADEELLDEKDSNQVKRSVAMDSFRMFDECVQNVYNARGPKLNAKEVIRLQMALLSFSMKCYRGNLDQVTHCLRNCVLALQQARDNFALMQENGPDMPPQQHSTMSKTLDEISTKELEKLLSIPLDEMALGVLSLDYYTDLIAFLPWANRRQVALNMLNAVSNAGKSPESVKEIEELFTVIAPVLRDVNDAPPATHQEMSDNMERTANLMAGLGVSPQPQRYLSQQSSINGGGDQAQNQHDAALVSKLIDMLDNPDTDVLFEMLSVARNHLNSGKKHRVNTAYVSLVFASLKLARRIYREEHPEPEMDAADIFVESKSEEKEKNETAEEPEKVGEPEVDADGENDEEGGEKETDQVRNAEAPEKTQPEVEEAKPTGPKTVSCRKVFIFVQETIASFGKVSPERGIKLYLEAALTADKLGAGDAEEKHTFGAIAYELISQAFALYEDNANTDSRIQSPCVMAMIGTLLSCRSLSKEDYESLIMKCSKYAAKILKKPEQCEMVSKCSHLFYVVDAADEITVVYSNPQRCLECLQRALKLADACTNSNPANLKLFVDLLELYLYFFEKRNPKVTANYITGLVALIKEHSSNLGQFGGSIDNSPVGEAKAHFLEIIRYIKRRQSKEGEVAEAFEGIDVSTVQT